MTRSNPDNRDIADSIRAQRARQRERHIEEHEQSAGRLPAEKRLTLSR